MSYPPEPICVHCRSRFTRDPQGSLLRCSGCARTFPIVADRLPILVADPARYVAAERMVQEQILTYLDASAAHYERLAANDGPRAEVQAGIAAGLGGNYELIEQLAALLPDGDDELEDYQPTLGVDLFATLRRDWGGFPETEAEIRVTVQAILGALGADLPVTSLLLGAGGGRVLAELGARLPGLVGIDYSFSMAASWLILSRQGKLMASHLLTGNFRRAADETERFVARRDLAAGDAPYLVANATDLPYPDACFEAVLSPYFTDLLPFSQLLPEVHRVLRPDGRFIHFGPLGYAFAGEAEYYALDQVPAAMAAHGLKVESRELVRNSYFADARRLNQVSFDNLVLVARRA